VNLTPFSALQSFQLMFGEARVPLAAP